MSGRQTPPARPTTVAAHQPQRIRPRQVWQTLTPGQQQQVLGRLVAMCCECDHLRGLAIAVCTR